MTMPTDSHEAMASDITRDIPMPQLTDCAVIQIHTFIEHFLDLFEARYGDQIHRYYEDRSAHNIAAVADPPPDLDDPPF
jgi:hypothetical protein